MIIVHSFESLKESFEARASEWSLTGVMVSLALAFLFNEGLFYRDTLEGMRDIINSRFAWITIMSFVGLTRFAVLIVNGAYWRTPHLRSLTAFLSAGIWFLFFMGFVRNGSLMMAIMPWVFLLDAYNAKRAGREAGKSEFQQRYIRKREQVDARMALGAER